MTTMKNKLILALAVGIILLMQSCIPSLHPLYTKNQLVFDESILGLWSDGPDQKWEFVRGDGQNYNLTYTEKDKSVKYKVHLILLGDSYFLDFYLNENLDDNFITPLIPSHSFAKIVEEEGKLSIYFFDYEWLEKLFKQRKIRLKHEVIDDGTIVLTASTEELQKFVQKYAHEEAAFVEPSRLERVH